MKAHLAYLKYVLRHKWYVFQECWRLRIPLRGIIHDLSKFGPSEWGPYVDYFYRDYPPYGDVSVYQKTYYGDKWTKEWAQERFDEAWLHHQHANPHHWQHWVLREDDGKTKCLRMPYKCMLEMVADWYGAGVAIKGKPTTDDGQHPTHYSELRSWYLANRDKMQLHPVTRHWVEITIGLRVHDLTEQHSANPITPEEFLTGLQ